MNCTNTHSQTISETNMEVVTLQEICLEDSSEIYSEDVDEIMEWVFGDCEAKVFGDCEAKVLVKVISTTKYHLQLNIHVHYTLFTTVL